jgi:hypothetical protein
MNYPFINGKKVRLAGKTLAQLQHLLQLAQDQVKRYEQAIVNYPPNRMENYGKPHLARLQDTVNSLQTAIDNNTT